MTMLIMRQVECRSTISRAHHSHNTSIEPEFDCSILTAARQVSSHTIQGGDLILIYIIQENKRHKVTIWISLWMSEKMTTYGIHATTRDIHWFQR